MAGRECACLLTFKEQTGVDQFHVLEGALFKPLNWLATDSKGNPIVKNG
jgi:hypothetical protein